MTSNPLSDPAPSEVPLARAPLANVICVAHFPAILKIIDASGAGVAQFQEAIRRGYPTLTQEAEHAFSFQFDEKGGVVPQAIASTIWRFVDSEQKWRVTLGRESLGLECHDNYTSRNELLDRFASLADALAQTLEPASCTRIGVRYVNVIGGSDLDRLADFVRPEFRAFGTPPFLENVLLSNQVAEFVVPEGTLVARAGLLKSGQTHDPNALHPAEIQRYYLDLDAIRTLPQEFTVASIRASVTELSERAYSMFRGAVTETFLAACNA